MDARYHVIVNSIDHINSKSINFHPIQSNLGDTDCAEPLKPSFEEESDQNTSKKMFYNGNIKKSKHQKVKTQNENYFISRNPAEKPCFELNFSNNSFSFANGIKISNRENDIGDASNLYDTSMRWGVSPSSAFERLFQLSAVLKEKKELEIREKEIKVKKSCSFRPRINKKSSNLALTRSFKDLISCKNASKIHEISPKHEKIERVPKINQKSIEIFRKSDYSHSPIYNRLYYNSLIPDSKDKITTDSKRETKSKINRKTLQKAAEKFKREYSSILNSIMISEGALSKDFTQEQVEKIMISLGFLRGNQSEDKHEEKMLFNLMWSILILDQNPKISNKVSIYTLLRFLLCVLGIDPKKITKIFEDGVTNRRNTINNNCAGQLSRDEDELNEAEDLEENENDRNFMELMEFSTEEDLCRYKTLETIKSLRDTNGINRDLIKDMTSPKNNIYVENDFGTSQHKMIEKTIEFDMKDIHKRFQLFARNRLMSQNEQTFKIQVENHSFTPTILKHSKDIASKSREKVRKSSPITINDLFNGYNAQKKAKINSLYVNKIEQIAGSCSFKPESLAKNENSNKDKDFGGTLTLKKLSSPKFKIPQRIADEKEFEKVKKECTFKPNVLKSKATNSSKSKKPSFLRNNKSREGKENKENQNNQDNLPAKGKKDGKSLGKDRECLLIDVKLKEGIKEKILVPKNSDLSEILRGFVLKHSLNSKQKTTLYEQIIKQISCSNAFSK